MGLAISGGHIYMASEFNGDVFQLNSNGSFNQTIASNIYHPLGIVTNPVTGDLYVSTENGNSILDINPNTKTVTTFLSNVPRPDGLSISADGSTLYVAGTTGGGGGHILGYNTTTGQQVFDSGNIGGGSDSLDGTALGYGTLAGNIFANTNDGRLIEINLATKTQTLIASGGSRGDFVAVDPNGTLLITQSDSILRLTPGAGGSFNPVPEPSSMVLLGIGLVSLGAYAVRKRRKLALV